jgi:hypothetical protein
VGFLLFTSSSLLLPPPLLQTLRASELLHSPARSSSMRFKTHAQKNKMGKSTTTNASTNWVPTEFKQTDLTKAQAELVLGSNYY